MKHAQGGAAAQQQRRPTVTGQGVAEEAQLVGVGKALDGVVTEEVEGVADLGDVFLDQVLGAHPGASVEGRVAHVAQVVVQAFPQGSPEPLVVVFLVVMPQIAQALVDEFVVIEVGGKILLPLHVALQVVELQRRRLPYLVVGGFRQHLTKFPDPAVCHTTA